jgi:hypothetical protein
MTIVGDFLAKVQGQEFFKVPYTNSWPKPCRYFTSALEGRGRPRSNANRSMRL